MVKGLRERLADNERVIVAEGYLFEFERRGYLCSGPFVPEVVIEHPELVTQLTEEFVHAGSDVALAFTYYAHRSKLKVIGRDGELEKINRNALRIAKSVANKHGVLMAGNICNGCIYDPQDPRTWEDTKSMFKEQIEWAVEEGADFIVAETFTIFDETKLALECIKEYGNGLPAVITLAQSPEFTTREGMSYADACRTLEDLGADVVGLNCSTGPRTMIDLLKPVRAACKGPIAAVPVPYRTHENNSTFQTLTIPETGSGAFPNDLDYFTCPQSQIHEFGQACEELGVQYVGLCCGNSSRYVRALAESLGRKPEASKYSTRMDLHYMFGKRGTVVKEGSDNDKYRNIYDPNKKIQA